MSNAVDKTLIGKKYKDQTILDVVASKAGPIVWLGDSDPDSDVETTWVYLAEIEGEIR